VLARLYVARADVAYTVRNAALHVWKTLVVNTPKTLAEVLEALMREVIAGLADPGAARAQRGAQRLLGGCWGCWGLLLLGCCCLGGAAGAHCQAAAAQSLLLGVVAVAAAAAAPVADRPPCSAAPRRRGPAAGRRALPGRAGAQDGWVAAAAGPAAPACWALAGWRCAAACCCRPVAASSSPLLPPARSCCLSTR
jgi:hypothetical protein